MSAIRGTLPPPIALKGNGMQIGSTELLIILIIVIIAFSLYGGRLSSSARSSSPRASQEAKDGQAGDENPESARSEDPRTQAGAPRTSSTKDPYAVLNIPRNATQDEVNAAYRKMAQMYHPDKVAGLAPEYHDIAETKMKDINAAYEQIRHRSGTRR
jgi:hypothetical protein